MKRIINLMWRKLKTSLLFEGDSEHTPHIQSFNFDNETLMMCKFLYNKVRESIVDLDSSKV
jgi:hypothetical protein